jgi:hypothetical protein
VTDKSTSTALRNRVIKGVIQATVMFSLLWIISLFLDNRALAGAFHRAAFFCILLVAGYTMNRFYNDLEKVRRGRNLYYAGTALGMVIGGLGLWLALASFNEFMEWPGKIALIILCGITGVAVPRLAVYRGKRERGLWWGLAGWLVDRPAMKFLFGIIIGLYVVYFRPHFTIDPNSLRIIEWFLLGMLGFIIFFRVWLGVGRDYIEEEAGKNWKKHRPELETLISTSHDYLVRVERQFINMGEPMGLYVLLIVLLNDNRFGENDIVQSVESLVNFRGINETRQNTLRLSRRAERQQLNLRREALRSTFDNINRLISPRGATLPRYNNLMTRNDTMTHQEEITTDELRLWWLETGDKTGLFVRLTLMLHRTGQYKEHIVSTLRQLLDNRGTPSDLAIKTLIERLERGALAKE